MVCLLVYEEQRLKLEGMRPELNDLGESLGLEAARREVSELHEKAAQPDFWNGDMEESQKVLRHTRHLEDKISGYEALQKSFDDTLTLIQMADEDGDDSMAAETAEAVGQIAEKMEAMRLTTLLKGEYDAKNAIMTFHAGAGGTEAQDWASMLYRMYMHWAENHGFKVNLMDYLDGEEAGLKSATIVVEGENAFGFLKSEAGVHRLVRISPFDASGRRHTSFASVEVTPEIDADVHVDIDPKDLRVDTYHSSGAGGQNVNKTSSAVRVTHLPTGIVVACQTERSQLQNKETAMRMLASKLVEIKEREHYDKIADIKGDQKEIAWGSQIRSYVFMPYTLAKDHRTGFENGNIDAVMDGDLDGFINAYLKAASLGQLEVK